MEADNGYQMKDVRDPELSEAYGSCVTPKLVKWKGDWNIFKKLFRAASARDGVAEALEMGERVTKGQSWPSPDTQKSQDDQDAMKQEENALLYMRAAKQSSKLSDLLVLTLGETVGIQQSIVMEETEVEGDGVTMWSKLISHFERRTMQLNAIKLLNEWENETLRTGEHPDELYTRLTTKRTLLQRLGEVITETNLTRRFVDAIKRRMGNPYNDVITSYEGQMIRGDPYTINQLREFLALKHTQAEQNETEACAMPGFANIENCSNCGKIGHREENCWKKKSSNQHASTKHKDTRRIPKGKQTPMLELR